MGYERNDRRYGRDQGVGSYSQDRAYDRGYGRDRYDQGRGSNYGGGDRAGERNYGRQPQGYDYDDRGFFDRAGDEVRSWFGDEDAERRRQMDERYREREDVGDRNQPGSRGPGRDFAGADYGRERGMMGGFGSTSRGTALGYSPSDYGAGRGAGATSSWGLGAGNDRNEWGYDSNYRSWRDRQIASLDRDYDDYRREHQSKFDTEFHSWRTTRQGQREHLGKVREHQEVVGSDGQHIGTIDKVRGDRIILTKSDKDAHGHHHSIPCAWIKEVGDKVTITKSADEAQSHWRDEERNSAMFGGNRDEDRMTGDHNLNRSFSGTY